MRFSLLFVLCLLTLSCFVALNIGYRSKAKEMEVVVSELQAELGTFDDRLERDVRLLKLGDHPDVDKIEFMENIKAQFANKIENQKLNPDFVSDKLVVRHVPSSIPDTVTLQQPLVLQIYVPKGWQAKWLITPFDTLVKEAKEICDGVVLDFDTEKEFALPVGLSKLVITNEHNFTRFSKFTFTLNGKVIEKIKTVPPPREEFLARYFFGGGMINYAIAKSRISIDTPGRLLVAQSLYQDLKENGEGIRAQIGFRCSIESNEKEADVSGKTNND